MEKIKNCYDMKTIKIKQGLFALLASFALAACTSEVVEPQQEGNPTLQVESQFANVYFGDLLPFEVSVSDEVPLSTLTARRHRRHLDYW